MTSSAREILVDLGDMSEPSPIIVDGGPPWPRARFPRVVVVAVIALLLLGSAAPGPRPLLTQVAEVAVGANAQILIDGDRMYVGSYDLRNTLVAYDLRSHHRLWATDGIPRPGQGLLLLPDGTIVSSSAYDAGPEATNTEAFDASTGRQLWSSSDDGAVLTGHGLLVQTPLPAAAFPNGLVNPTGYQLLDPRSGRVIWTVRIPDGCVTTIDEAALPDRLVEMCAASGTIRVIGLADGSTLAKRSAPLGGDVDPASVNPSEEMDEPQAVIVGQTLLIAHANVPTPTVDAYVLDTLATRWGGVAEQFAQAITVCGDQICFYQTPDAGFRVDVATGASLGPAAPMLTDALPSPDGTLLLVESDSGVRVVIPTGPIGEAVTVQPDGTGPVWLARPPRSFIGPLAGAGATACVQIGDYVACATTDSRVRVWYVPR